jgi:hemerythrin superfamily protein
MTDFLTLLRRDHHDLEVGLDELLRAGSMQQMRTALDGVRLGLVAHAEAEDIVLYSTLEGVDARDALEPLLGQARDAHLAEEGALASLVIAPPGSTRWRERAKVLAEMVREHAYIEEELLVPALRQHAPEAYEALAGRFATERLCQLAMQEPSSVHNIAELARAS